MTNLKIRAFTPNSLYYIMTEQPNCCPTCQSRLDIIETVMIQDEMVQVNYCDECNLEVLMVDDDVELWNC
jgi:hypothetical protein